MRYKRQNPDDSDMSWDEDDGLEKFKLKPSDTKIFKFKLEDFANSVYGIPNIFAIMEDFGFS